MNILDSFGNKVDTDLLEKQEQELAAKYIFGSDVVLELGARYGSVSCVINSKLTNKKNQVVVEPDDRVWEALEKNRNNNNCKFDIVKGFISRKKLGLTNLDEYYGGYGSTFIENNDTKVQSFTLENVSNKYNLKFNVLVADCEGFLEIFLDENPNLYDDLRLLIFEADYETKCNYDKIKNNLREKHFHNILDGFQNVWVKSLQNVNINHYVIHCWEHNDREEYLKIIEEWLGRPFELFRGVYSKHVKLSEQLDYMMAFNPKFKFSANSIFRFSLSGQIGCYLSHFKILEKILNNNKNNKLLENDYSVVFEDDVTFDRCINLQVEEIIKNLNNLGIDFDLIFLGNHNNNHGQHVVSNIYKLDPNNYCWGTHAMLIKNKNVEKIYNSLLNIKYEVDGQYKIDIDSNILNGFVIYPCIAGQKCELVSHIKRN